MKKLAFALLIGLLLPKFHHAQCCAQGTPMGGSSNQGILGKGDARIISFFTHSESIKQNPESNYFLILDANFNFVGTNVQYGLTNKLTVEADVGYFINKTQRFDLTPVYTQTGFGLSNGTVGVRHLLYKNKERNIEITGGLGLKFPFSMEYQKVDNVQLPVDNQPSTCAFGIVPKILIFKKFPKQKMGMFFIHKYDKNFINQQNYEYGAGFISALFISKSLNFISCNTFGVLQFRNAYRLSDVSYTHDIENVITSTGSNSVFIAPQFGHTFKSKYSIAVSYDYPIYQKFNTEKLKNKYAITLNFIADLNGNSATCEKPAEGDFTKEKFKVYGNCSMCKTTIEKALNGQEGIASASWNVNNKKLYIQYDKAVISLDQIKQKLADVGYDTDTHRAKDEVYKGLHSCCQYKRPE